MSLYFDSTAQVSSNSSVLIALTRIQVGRTKIVFTVLISYKLSRRVNDLTPSGGSVNCATSVLACRSGHMPLVRLVRYKPDHFETMAPALWIVARHSHSSLEPQTKIIPGPNLPNPKMIMERNPSPIGNNKFIF